jgi:hypothetical protein
VGVKWLPSLPHCCPLEYRHFTVETGKTEYTFATQCIYFLPELLLFPFFQPYKPFYVTFQCGCKNILFLFKKFFAPQNLEKLPSNVSHNPTRPPVFSPASFCFVKLRHF